MLTESKIYILFCFVIGLGLCSCNHHYYAPDEGHLITLDESQDVKFSAALPDGDNPSLSVQTGYSPTNHLGIQASYYNYSKRINDDEKFGEGSIGSLAIGSYYSLSLDRQDSVLNSGAKENLLFDLYVGYSRGTIDNYYDPGLSSHFNFNKKYLQLGLHLQTRLIGLDVVTKLGRLDFDQGRVIGELEERDFKDIENLQLYDTYLIRETSVRILLGLRKVRFFMTFTRLNSPELDRVRFIDRTFHLGTIIDINELFKKNRI